jgi:hypothetical protein
MRNSMLFIAASYVEDAHRSFARGRAWAHAHERSLRSGGASVVVLPRAGVLLAR